MGDRPRRSNVTRALCGLVLVLVLGGLSPVSAQQGPPDCNPDAPPGRPCDPGPPDDPGRPDDPGPPGGCGPPDPYTGQRPDCPRNINVVLSIQAGPVGVTVRVRASGFNIGDIVEGTFDGEQVFQTIAEPSSETAQGVLARSPLAALRPGALLGALDAVLPGRGLFGAQATQSGAIDETFTVPNRAPGIYQVCVSGSGAQGCADFEVVARTAVAGTQFSRGEGSPVSNDDGASNGARVLGRTYARTGAALGLLAVIGASLVVFGRSLGVASKWRRRARA